MLNFIFIVFKEFINEGLMFKSFELKSKNT